MFSFTKLFLSLSIFTSLYGFSQQKELQVNSKTVDYNVCREIKQVKQIPEISAGFICDIRDAQIIDDCIELTISYGGCGGNLELMTDNTVDKNTHFNLKARWMEPSMCKAFSLIKVSFNLKPYKELIKDKTATIKLSGTNFELFYNN